MATNKKNKPNPAPADNSGTDVPAIRFGVGKAELRLEFAAWLISPDRKGTQAAWAKEHGVDQTTLSAWKKHPDVVAVISSWRDPFKAAFGEVASALFQRAKKGHVPSARTLADILGEMSPAKMELGVGTLADFFRGEGTLESIKPYAAISASPKGIADTLRH